MKEVACLTIWSCAGLLWCADRAHRRPSSEGRKQVLGRSPGLGVGRYGSLCGVGRQPAVLFWEGESARFLSVQSRPVDLHCPLRALEPDVLLLCSKPFAGGGKARLNECVVAFCAFSCSHGHVSLCSLASSCVCAHVCVSAMARLVFVTWLLCVFVCV